MLISPPFLPDRLNNQTDEAWLASAMQPDPAGHGKFPVSMKVGWHGGIHLLAPISNNARLPVRAIADGTVVFIRKPKTPNTSPADPLNYGGSEDTPLWTSDGCVIIKHTTEIGADANDVATEVVFYSVYMHLSSIKAEVKANSPIYRKDEIGLAGQIYGQPNKIHFEIVCDDDNLQRLVGRVSGDLPIKQDGRVDSVYGDIYFHLPVGSLIFSRSPIEYRLKLRYQQALVRKRNEGFTKTNEKRKKQNEKILKDNEKKVKKKPLLSMLPLLPIPTELPNPPAQTGQTATELFVSIKYLAGQSYTTTYNTDGMIVGTGVFHEQDFEYDLYSKASELSEYIGLYNADRNQPNEPVPSVSAAYELLRFGRVLGPDPLMPVDTPNWRRVNLPNISGWVNLNVSGVHKFSDADFPHWRGWKLVDDSATPDSRCYSDSIRSILDANLDCSITPQEAASRLQDPEVIWWLSMLVCRFPTEWDKDAAGGKWSWLLSSSLENPEPLTGAQFKKYVAHIEALCFWSSQIGIPYTHWHFHPVAFINQFKNNGWLSSDELSQCIPRISSLGTTPWGTAHARGQTHHTAMSKMFRKYGFTTRNRMIHVLTQIYIETGMLRTMNEGGRGAPHPLIPMAQYYSVFFGRGYMQLTWPFNYEAYGIYRSFPDHIGVYVDPRITLTSTHYWKAPPGSPKQWFPRFDPDLVASDAYSAADSAGFYWVSKVFKKALVNINRVSDFSLEPRFVGFASWLVNGGGFGWNERQQFARNLYNVLLDSSPLTGIENYRFPRLTAALHSAFPPPVVENTQTIRVNYAKQIP